MWQPVDAETARRHPLHGMGGWLAVFSILLVLGTGYSLVTVAGALTDPTEIARVVSAATLQVLQAQALWMAATSILLLILWFARARPFRAIWTLILLANTALGAAAAYLVAADLQQRFGTRPGMEPATQAGIAIVAGLVGLLLFNWYMGASRRFRVTFQRQVKDGDPLLAAAAPSWQAPPAGWGAPPPGQQQPGWVPPPQAPPPGWGQPPPAQPPQWGAPPPPAWGQPPPQQPSSGWASPPRKPPQGPPPGWRQ